MIISKKLEDLLIKHEGLRLKPYKCSAGKTTIGVGRNIEDNGILQGEAIHMLHNDIERTVAELLRVLICFNTLSISRQHALIDMCFNLGLPRFLDFKKMIAALETGNFRKAADEMLDSRWARQVGKRSETLSKMILRG